MEIVAICDIDDRALNVSKEIISKSGKKMPQVYTGDDYAWKKLLAYMVISAAIYGVYALFTYLDLGNWANRGLGIVLLSLFGILVLNVEKKEFQQVKTRIFKRKVKAVV